MVERHLAKVDVAGSTPVSRSTSHMSDRTGCGSSHEHGTADVSWTGTAATLSGLEYVFDAEVAVSVK